MRLLLVLTLLAATPAAAAPAAKDTVPRRVCPTYAATPVQQPKAGPGLRRWAELPPANLERAVNRNIDGCPVPVVVRYRVDERAPPAAPRR